MSAELPEVVRKYLEAYNARDVGALVETVSEDVIFENLSNAGPPTRTEGRAAFEALARQSAVGFSSRRQSVLDSVVAGDQVALRVEFEARVAVDLPNGWKVGQQLRLQGASFFRLRDGRIERLVDLS
jgi:hypothetical protein